MTRDPAREIAAQLARRGWAVPARLLLDAHRPLAPLVSDLGAAMGPLLSAVGMPNAAAWRALLEDDAALDRLVAQFEGLEDRHAEPG